MDTLSYGYEKPENGDKGSVFFPALANNIQKTNDHTHNGSNSARLVGPTSATVATQTINSASWVDQGNGTYRQIVTMTSPYLYSEVNIQIKHATHGIVYADIKPHADTNKYYIYVNDNTLTLTAVYSA